MSKLHLLIVAHVWLGVSPCVQAGSEPLIPQALNFALPKIRAGLSLSQIEAVLRPDYPGVKGKREWMGKTGFFDFKLDERLVLSVCAINRDGKDVVPDEISLYVFDRETERRVDLKFHDSPEQDAEVPTTKKINGEGGADQPAVAPESKPEVKAKPQPESKVAPR